jgi:hypothetical protein
MTQPTTLRATQVAHDDIATLAAAGAARARQARELDAQAVQAVSGGVAYAIIRDPFPLGTINPELMTSLKQRLQLQPTLQLGQLGSLGQLKTPVLR